jgi:hypothetical protein
MDQKSKFKNLNISKKYSYFIWMPSKCGSTHASIIFKKFDDDFDFVHNHKMELFDGHWGYDLISLQRNPYTRFTSMFNSDYFNGYNKPLSLNEIRTEFNLYLNKIISHNYFSKEILIYHDRNPDYFIRLEHLFEDYSKIPFVRKTSFYKSGQLEIECSIPKNKTNPSGFSWQELYTPQTADFVYYNMSLIFDLCNYDKDSWKS